MIGSRKSELVDSNSLSSSTASKIPPSAPLHQKRVNLRSVIQLDEIEDLLSSLCNRIDAQEVVIADLQKLCASFVGKTEFHDRITSSNESIVKLNSKVDHLQELSVITIGNNIFSVGEIAMANRNQLNDITHSLPSLATREDLKRAYELIHGRLDKEIAVLREELSPLALSTALQRGQADIVNKLSYLESGLSCKLDKTEMGDVRQLVENLKLYENFNQDTGIKLKELEAGISKLESDLHSPTSIRMDIAAINDNLKNIENEMKDFSTKRDIRKIATEVEQISATITTLATKEKTNELSRIILRMDENHHALEAMTNIHIKEDFTALVHEVGLKANITDNMSTFVHRKHFEEIITVLGNTVDRKSELCDVALIDQRVEELEKLMKEECPKTEVAMRFIDWFSDRGINYEHNLKVLDKHIDKLSKDSLSSSKSKPFSGQIRYTSILADDKL
jgi:hypothetical protein